jgi:hypothetical protein
VKTGIVRFIVPIGLGILIWVLAFLLVGYTKMPGGPAELYLPMVASSSIIWTILLLVVFRWYARKWHIGAEWFREAALFGLTITILQFVLDLYAFLTYLSFTLETFVTEYLLKSTVLVMYPFITAETVAIGYLLKRFKKI